MGEFLLQLMTLMASCIRRSQQSFPPLAEVFYYFLSCKGYRFVRVFKNGNALSEAKILSGVP